MRRFRDLERLSESLREALRGPLPGARAQALMSPRPRHGWRPGELPEGCRAAAALLLLYTRHARVHLLLTLRHEDLSAHAGQVSLPGGAVEPGERRWAAALREAHEEVGLEPGRVSLLGELTSLHIPASRFHLHPFVGVARRLGELAPSDAEVSRILEVPLEDLATGSDLEVETRELRGGATEVPFFRIDDVKLWGATAMVVAELLALLEVPPDPWGETSREDDAGGTLADTGASRSAGPMRASGSPARNDSNRP